jgi:DNA repair protein RadD
VQNDPRHPDNYGYIVTHVGMNLDARLTDFRELEREDQQFLSGLLSGEEPEPPREVTEGRTQMKIRPDMMVHNEVIDSLIEEDFLDADDELVFEELRRNAETMGLDADAIVAAAKASKRASTRIMEAPESFSVSPQRARQEAQRRLNERIKKASQVLVNRVGLSPAGHEISTKLIPNLTGANFVAGIQIFGHRVKHAISTDPRGEWSIDELKRAMELLPEILESEVRRLKVKQRDDEKTRKNKVRSGLG